jgi:hypothetical protein
MLIPINWSQGSFEIGTVMFLILLEILKNFFSWASLEKNNRVGEGDISGILRKLPRYPPLSLTPTGNFVGCCQGKTTSRL